jgi:hypothetical protein
VALLGDVPEELIRAMVDRGRVFNYINKENCRGWTAATIATLCSKPASLDYLLTLGADPKRCREFTYRHEACIIILDRFEQRTTLACCLRHYEDLHVESPLLIHPDIAALDPFAKILHDLHGINGESHDLSRMILSFI